MLDVIVLALDTTTRTGSCALARDGTVVREETSDASLPPASRLPAELIGLLDRAGVGLDAIDVFAVATGPGSFTGLRVGIATMQGLAFAAGKPLIGISALDALADLARTATAATSIATWVDAWRGEVYAALYVDGREIEAPSVERPETIVARIAGTSPVFIGDGVAAHRAAIDRALGMPAHVVVPEAPALAGAIALAAARAAAAGERPSPDAIRPLYVRRPDVELARDARVAR